MGQHIYYVDKPCHDYNRHYCYIQDGSFHTDFPDNRQYIYIHRLSIWHLHRMVMDYMDQAVSVIQLVFVLVDNEQTDRRQNLHYMYKRVRDLKHGSLHQSRKIQDMDLYTFVEYRLVD
jgi:hypothetical protein